MTRYFAMLTGCKKHVRLIVHGIIAVELIVHGASDSFLAGGDLALARAHDASFRLAAQEFTQYEMLRFVSTCHIDV